MHSGWSDVQLGADIPQIQARLATQVGPNNLLNGWLKFRTPSGRVLMASMVVDLAPIEQELMTEAANQFVNQAPQEGAVSGGWLRRKLKKIKNKIKKIAKKIGHSKLVKGIVKVARKALDNPIVQAALASNPYGAAFLAVRSAAKMAVKAIKGIPKARNAIRGVIAAVKKGSSKGIKMARILKEGIKMAGLGKKLAKGAISGADEAAGLSALLGACLDAGASSEVVAGADQYLMAAGADEGDEGDHEADALEHFASAGAWDGLRWMASRLGPHSMAARPEEFTARSALMLGHARQAAA